jgi:hypothetical protein
MVEYRFMKLVEDVTVKKREAKLVSHRESSSCDLLLRRNALCLTPTVSDSIFFALNDFRRLFLNVFQALLRSASHFRDN